MQTSSRKILESFRYKFSFFKNIYELLDINNISSVLHEEHNNLLSKFHNPKIIIIIGIITECFIIEKESSNNFNILCINSEVIYKKRTKGKLKKEMLNILKNKDFVQHPLIKKIIIINDYSKMNDINGTIFYEYGNNKYSSVEPDSLMLNFPKEVNTPSQIINLFFNSF